MASKWQMIRARAVERFAMLIGVPVTIDIEFFFPELKRLPTTEGLKLSKNWLPQKDLREPNLSPDSAGAQ